MTLLECLYKFLITDDGNLAAKLPGGLEPRLVIQGDVQTFQTMMVMRSISGESLPPTHDGGVSSWSSVRIELTVWGLVDKDLEQTSLYVMGKFSSFNSYLGGSTNGRFCATKIHGPRNITDEGTRLPGVQIDVQGLLDRSTLS